MASAMVARKIAGLPDAALRASPVPSEWTPMGLLKDLVYVERRWRVWGFLAEPVPDPWGDDETEGRWYASPAETVADLLSALRAGGTRTRAIAEGAQLSDQAAVGGRFDVTATRPTLAWTLLHVLQEYTRHTGHLDVARELIDGAVGE